jgi:hypothetical protein
MDHVLLYCLVCGVGAILLIIGGYKAIQESKVDKSHHSINRKHHR